MIIPGIYFLLKNIKNKDFRPRASFWALLFLIIICWLSVLSNWNELEKPFKHIFQTKYYLIGLLSTLTFFYLNKNYLNQKKKILLFRLFLISTNIATICGLIGLWTGYTPLKFQAACHATRACGLYGMCMTYGYGISLFSVLLVGITLQSKRFAHFSPPWLLWSSLIINLTGTFFSFARGGWLGLILAVPFLFFKSHKKQFFLTIIGAIILLGGLITFSPKVRDVFLNRQSSNLGRIAFYKAAYRAFTENPFFGVGFKNFEANSTKIKKKYNIEYPDRPGHAHSNILEQLGSTGLLGCIAFLLFLFFWLRETYDQPILFAFVVSFSISGLFQYTFGDGENVFLIMAIFAYSPYLLPTPSSS